MVAQGLGSRSGMMVGFWVEVGTLCQNLRAGVCCDQRV